MSLFLCCDCKNPFERDAVWMVRCLECWKINKNVRTKTSQYQKVQDAYDQEQYQDVRTRTSAARAAHPQAKPAAAQPNPQQQAEILKLKQEVESLRRQLLLEKGKPKTMVHTSNVKSAIPKDMLARLIRLAHPDRHNNSEVSNMATAWLLSQRSS